MAAKNAYKAGDLVVLKGGGPVMTITHVSERYHDDNDNNYHCVWFSGKKRESADFPGIALNPAPKEEAKS